MSKKIILLLLIFIAGSIQTISAQQITATGAVFVVNRTNGNNSLQINTDKVLALDASGDIQVGNVVLTVTDSKGTKTVIPVNAGNVVAPAGARPTSILITATTYPALATAETFEVTVSDVHFVDEVFSVSASGDVIDSQTNLDQKRKIQQDAVAAAKPTENKNFYAGFNFASGNSGKAEGNGELVTNIPLPIPNFFATLNLKKSSKEDADPKQFEIGLAYRATSLSPFFKDDLETALSSGNQIAIANEISKIQRKRFLLGFLTEFSGRIEGEAMNFNTTNAIFDVMPFQLVSRVKQLGTSNVFMKFHIIPAGFEFGRNLRTENETVNKYYITRFKIGGELGFVYAPRNLESPFPIKRAELNMRAINRYLFRNETAFDPTTDEATGVSKGNKTYFQLDAKIYFSETDKGRFGFKVSRIRGGLPPTFNDTRAFTYGLIFESTEDKDK